MTQLERTFREAHEHRDWPWQVREAELNVWSVVWRNVWAGG